MRKTGNRRKIAKYITNRLNIDPNKVSNVSTRVTADIVGAHTLTLLVGKK